MPTRKPHDTLVLTIIVTLLCLTSLANCASEPSQRVKQTIIDSIPPEESP